MMAGWRRRCEVAGRASIGGWAVSLAVGCGQLIGIPSDPELVEPAPLGSGAAPASPEEPALAPGGAGAAGEPLASPGQREPSGGGEVVPAAGAALAPAASAAAQVDAGAPPSAEPGAPEPDAGPLPAPPCAPPLGRRVDVVMLFDNSGSMAAEARAFEAGLPAFVAELEAGGLDHRLILISRHRQDEPSASEEASTSVCIEAPVSGLEACPSDEPVLSERFFQYSVKLDASDSFERLLESMQAPDRFDLAPRGWAQWLRSGAQAVLVEISDADSDMPVDELLEGLAAASPERFAASGAPGFVFHSIVGLAGKGDGLDRYEPEEPLEPRTCSGAGSGPDNAGERYQALSRLTGGLRLPVCPASALDERLLTLAADIVERGGCE